MRVFFAVSGFALVAMGVGLLAASLLSHNEHNQLVGYNVIIVGLLVGGSNK